jgi:hypothetical protein
MKYIDIFLGGDFCSSSPPSVHQPSPETTDATRDNTTTDVVVVNIKVFLSIHN